jgi:hypothetical protein
MREAQAEFNRVPVRVISRRSTKPTMPASGSSKRLRLSRFVAGAAAPRLASSLNVHTAGVEGPGQVVPAAGVLEALRDQLVDLDLAVLTTRP